MNALAVRNPSLPTAVPFYGKHPPAEVVGQIEAPLLLHFAEFDGWVNECWPAYEAALKANGRTYTAHAYPGASDGFHNDTTPRFDEDAAALCWKRTLIFFGKHPK